MYTAILRFFRFHGRHLDFRQNGTVDFVGDGTIEKPTPENIGVDTKITFLSGRIAEIEWGVPPGRSCYKFGPAVRGLIYCDAVVQSIFMKFAGVAGIDNSHNII